jgi:hypothetical protein
MIYLLYWAAGSPAADLQKKSVTQSKTAIPNSFY